MKTLFYTLAFIAGIGSVQAQHFFRQDSLGISLDFPCVPQPLQEEISTPAGPVQLKGYLCTPTSGEVYMFAYNSMQGLVESPAAIRATLDGAKNGMTGKLGATVKGEKYRETEGLSTLSFSFSSSLYRGSGCIMFARGTLLQLLYMTSGKPDKKGWKRFSRSFTMNGVQ